MHLLCKRENPITLKVYPQKDGSELWILIVPAAHTQEIQSYYFASMPILAM